MHFSDMPYQRITCEEIEADYQALYQALQGARCEADCLEVLRQHNRLCGKMSPMDLCYRGSGRHSVHDLYHG